MPRKEGEGEKPKGRTPKAVKPEEKPKLLPDLGPELEALFGQAPVAAPTPQPKPKPEPKPVIVPEPKPPETHLVVTATGIQEVASGGQLIEAPQQAEQQELNLDTLTQIYHRGSFEVIQALFSQASQEAGRLAKVRENLKVVEEKLFDPITISTMNNDELIRIAELSQRALTGSTNYLFKLHSGMTTGLEVIGTLQKTQASAVKDKIDNPDLDMVKRELGDLLLQKIKEKSAKPNVI